MENNEIQALWFNWLKSEKTFTAQQVAELLEKVKEFNAGAIDQYLTKHVDEAFNQWIKDNQ